MAKKKQKKTPSQLRFDLISKDWVVIATGRAKRPESFKKEKRIKKEKNNKDCVFCDIASQEKPVSVFCQGRKINSKQPVPKNWTVVSIPNKYPAFVPFSELAERKEGPFYKKMNAVGFHEVVVTRDHFKSLAQLKVNQVKEVFDLYQDRYQSLMKENFVNYISIFHNHGVEAGASISHPHSQIITTPLIDVDLNKALINSGNHYQRSKKCIYCQMNKWEIKVKKRIVFQNKHFIALCPFASKSAFQVIVSPKKHLSYFEQITEQEKTALAECFQTVLAKIYKGLADPAYNFYLHTVPCDGQNYPYYHWHWTILPKTSIWAGFEIGTRMEISVVEPEKAAQYLRKQ